MIKTEAVESFASSDQSACPDVWIKDLASLPEPFRQAQSDLQRLLVPNQGWIAESFKKDFRGDNEEATWFSFVFLAGGDPPLISGGRWPFRYQLINIPRIFEAMPRMYISDKLSGSYKENLTQSHHVSSRLNLDHIGPFFIHVNTETPTQYALLDITARHFFDLDDQFKTKEVDLKRIFLTVTLQNMLTPFEFEATRTTRRLAGHRERTLELEQEIKMLEERGPSQRELDFQQIVSHISKLPSLFQ